MAIKTTLTAKDYTGLKQEYSEKNIINNIFGQEYIITSSESMELNSTSGENPKVLEFAYNKLPSGSRLDERSFATGTVGWGQQRWLRVEDRYYRGSFYFQTEDVINNLNSLTVSLNVEYDNYQKNGFDGNILNGNNYDSNDIVFHSLNSEDLKTNNNGKLSQDGGVPKLTAKLTGVGLGGFGQNTESSTENRSYIRKKASQSNGVFTITVDFNILIWSASNTVDVNFIGVIDDRYYLNSATKATFTVKANTVNTEELEFKYNIDEFNPNADASRLSAKTYEMVTNEFLQTKVEEEDDVKTSYLLSNQVFDAYDKNRPLITFQLLNCKKYDDPNTGYKRYLQSEDLIQLEDVNKQMIGEEFDEEGNMIADTFEIVKVENVWNGSFNKIISCVKINT